MRAALYTLMVAAFGVVPLTYAQKREQRPAEQWHVVTAKVERVHREHGDLLKIPDPPDRTFEVWCPEYPATKLPIVSGKVYTLTILTEPYFDVDSSYIPHHSGWLSRQVLVKVV